MLIFRELPCAVICRLACGGSAGMDLASPPSVLRVRFADSPTVTVSRSSVAVKLAPSTAVAGCHSNSAPKANRSRSPAGHRLRGLNLAHNSNLRIDTLAKSCLVGRCDASLTWSARLNAARPFFGGRYMDNAGGVLFGRNRGRRPGGVGWPQPHPLVNEIQHFLAPPARFSNRLPGDTTPGN